MKVVVLAGGVGGARMALGFHGVVPAADLSVIVNVGDDERFHGLLVCPDLDTVLYTLAGVVDRNQAWGVADDGTRALEVLRRLDSPGAWMKLGDADLGLHIHRANRLAQGASLTAVMAEVARAFGLACALLPVTDTPSPTLVETDTGTLRFQEWFVRDRAQPAVRGLRFPEAAAARLTDPAAAALRAADLIVLAPSNPWLSIAPMLEVGGMRAALRAAPGVRLAVSPLIGGKAIKGPLNKLMQDLSLGDSQADIAAAYAGLADCFVIDDSDAAEAAGIARRASMEVVAMPTLIPDAPRAEALARRMLAHARGAARGARE